MSAEIINADRTLEQVTLEIRILTGQTVQTFCRIGKLLYEAKERVGHGKWGEYLEKEISYSQSTANNFMRLYDEYGEFGPKSQLIGNLGYTKALAMIALPAAERESFAEEHQVDKLSVAQLKAEIKKHQQRADDAEAEAASAAAKAIAAQDSVTAYQQKLREKQADIDGLRDQNADVTRENRELRAKLEAAENKPAQISAEQAERLRAEGAAKVEKQIREEFQLAAAEDQADFDALEAKAKAQSEQISELEKQLEAAKSAPTEVIQSLSKENDAKLADRDRRIAELEKQLAEKSAAAPAAAPVLAQSDKELIQELFNGIGERFNKLNGLLIKSVEKAPEVSAIIRRMATAQIQNVAKAFGLEVTVA